MNHAGHGGMDHSTMNHGKMDHSKMNHHAMPDDAAAAKKIASGWADAATPNGHKALSYKDLRNLGVQRDLREPEREIEVRLGGSMERYIWTLNGKRHQDAGPMVLHYGERLRLKFVNETMMAHPMHLHGMFVQLENGQPPEKRPNKHTIIVPPGKAYSVLLTADEPGAWAFHCHLLYHMLSGMMTTVIVPMPGEVETVKGGAHVH
jgi:FtsP/CotA-like multicopper oxidase with cupredoxin domain